MSTTSFPQLKAAIQSFAQKCPDGPDLSWVLHWEEEKRSRQADEAWVDRLHELAEQGNLQSTLDHLNLKPARAQAEIQKAITKAGSHLHFALAKKLISLWNNPLQENLDTVYFRLAQAAQHAQDDALLREFLQAAPGCLTPTNICALAHLAAQPREGIPTPTPERIRELLGLFKADTQNPLLSVTILRPLVVAKSELGGIAPEEHPKTKLLHALLPYVQRENPDAPNIALDFEDDILTQAVQANRLDLLKHGIDALGLNPNRLLKHDARPHKIPLLAYVILDGPKERATMIEWLSSHPRVDINAQDEEGNTPVFHATTLGNFRSVSSLIKAKANPSIPNNHGQSCITPALNASSSKVTQLILSRVDPNLRMPSGAKEVSGVFNTSTPNWEHVQLLLSHGFNPFEPLRPLERLPSSTRYYDNWESRIMHVFEKMSPEFVTALLEIMQQHRKLDGRPLPTSEELETDLELV